MAQRKVSRGIDRIIALAALDEDFRKRLLEDREAALASSDIELNSSERSILMSLRNAEIDRAVGKIHVPDIARRKFLAGSVRTAVTIIIGLGIFGFVTYTALPMLLESKSAAQEAGAISALRDICTLQHMYAQEHGRHAASLAELAEAKLIDGSLRDGRKDGYVIELSNVTDKTFQVRAIPVKDGMRFFYLDENGIMHYSYGPEVGPDSQKLGG